jgi:hypothetical protein
MEFLPKTNGVFVFEMAGNPRSIAWLYRIWQADLWRCPNCGFEIVSGFGNNPLMEHFQDGFDEFADRVKADPTATIIYDYETAL